MKEVVYGYSKPEKNISYDVTPIKYVSEESESRDSSEWKDDNYLSDVPDYTKDDDDFER